MLFIVQSICFIFIVFSFILVIGISISFALPQNWSQNKSFILSRIDFWFIFVIFVRFLNSFVI